jgi:hemolysin activation/secretion protein
LHWLALVLTLAVPAVATAQTPGEAARQFDPNIQRERTLREREYRQEREQEDDGPGDAPVIEGPAPGGEGNLPESGQTFTLEEIRFNESAFIDAGRLEAIAADYTARAVRFADLNEMIGRINRIYAERGIVSARALIPPQTVEGGVLRVRLVEGRLGALEIDGNERTRRGFIAGHVPVAQGEVVDVPALREALTWLNRTSELRAGAALRPGAEPGETDVVLRMEEPSRYSAQVFTDNSGSESTGEYRGGATFQVYAPLGIDDRFTAYAVGSEGAENLYLAYRFPFNNRGGRIDLSWSGGDIEVIDGAFEQLDITGSSTSYDLNLTQPLLRGDELWADVSAGAGRSDSSTDIAGAPLSDFEVTRYTLGLQLRGFGDHSLWSLRQDLADAEVENIFGESSDYLLWNGSGRYRQALGERWAVQFAGAWQYADEKTVPSPLLFEVGGVTTVRGYPEGAVAGARGYTAGLEGRYRWREGVEPYAFLDYGRIEDISPDSENLGSVGFGLSWRYSDSLNAEVAYGRTLEDVLPDQDDGRVHFRLSWSWAS